MIESFSISNYMSYRDKTELSFLASKKEGGEESIPPYWYKEIGDRRILKLLIGVGLNASGKSKMVSALSYLQKLATIRRDKPSDRPVYRPFELDSDSRNRPTEIWITFYDDNTRYEYYIMVSRDRIEREELKELKDGGTRVQRVFYRSYSEASNMVEIVFGQSCTMSKQDQRALQANIISNSTVLSQFGNMNLDCPQLRAVYDYFTNRISRISRGDKTIAEKLQTGNDVSDQKMKQLVLKVLEDIGSNIVDYHIDTIEISLNDLLSGGAPPMLINLFKEQNPDGVHRQKNLLFYHQTPNGRMPLDMQLESQGTMNIIRFMVAMYDVVIGRKCTCVDEQGDGLHPIALEYILRTYLELADDSQIVLMTHDLSLLAPSQMHFRRDALRKFSKDEFGVTTVSRPSYLHNTMSLYKNYLKELESQLPKAISSHTMDEEYKSII